jgi:hypothetical protein
MSTPRTFVVEPSAVATGAANQLRDVASVTTLRRLFFSVKGFDRNDVEAQTRPQAAAHGRSEEDG